MADIRIKVAKDKASLVKALRSGDGSSGLFNTYYEVVAFAAALGIQRKRYSPFSESESSREIDPIRQEQFASKGYDQLINLVALMHEKKTKILGDLITTETERVSVFEAYANGGLEVLEEEIIRGTSDISNQILLLITSTKNQKKSEEDDLDLSFL